jgi:hypothetical protein
MISLLLEKKRKKTQKTVLGIEYGATSLAAVQLAKNGDDYSLVSCDSDIFTEEAYFEGELTVDYLSDTVSRIIKQNKLGHFSKLGFTSYRDIDVIKDEIICDKRVLSQIEEEGIENYIVEVFLKKKFPDDYEEIGFNFYDMSEEDGVIAVYYTSDPKYFTKAKSIAQETKKALSVYSLNEFSFYDFVNELFLSEVSKNKSDSVFLGLYAEKLCICSFSPKGKLNAYEAVKIFNKKITTDSYVDEVIQLLLRFIDFMSLDFSNMDPDEDFSESLLEQNNKVYIYGLKDNFNEIFESIKDLSMKDCEILNPFINIKVSDGFGQITDPHKYVMPVSIAMMEAV